MKEFFETYWFWVVIIGLSLWVIVPAGCWAVFYHKPKYRTDYGRRRGSLTRIMSPED